MLKGSFEPENTGCDLAKYMTKHVHCTVDTLIAGVEDFPLYTTFDAAQKLQTVSV